MVAELGHQWHIQLQISASGTSHRPSWGNSQSTRSISSFFYPFSSPYVLRLLYLFPTSESSLFIHRLIAKTSLTSPPWPEVKLPDPVEEAKYHAGKGPECPGDNSRSTIATEHREVPAMPGAGFCSSHFCLRTCAPAPGVGGLGRM